MHFGQRESQQFQSRGGCGMDVARGNVQHMPVSSFNVSCASLIQNFWGGAILQAPIPGTGYGP